MPTALLLVPAYGRRYSSKQDAEKDWKEGRDFKIYNGPYTSIRDSKKLHELADLVLIYHGDSNDLTNFMSV